MTTFRQIFKNTFTREEISTLILFEIITGIILSFLSLLIYLYITGAVTSQETIFIDNQISVFLLQFRSGWITGGMLFTSFLGNETIIFFSALIAIFLTLKKHHRETFIFTLLVIMGILATNGLKLIYKVPRPDLFPLVFENSYSFPSGHALNSFLFYSTVSYFVYHFTKNKKLTITVALISLFLVGLIGISRVYLGVHHPSDVVAGYIIGFWLLTTTILVDKTITFFNFISEKNKT
ncbi:phosphatase PAP2 family protein [Candidatus Curtissbacteria bacterium]|nr:phosphatase PAP2 family protein [Candidatus Curtissbacteria bacterium]